MKKYSTGRRSNPNDVARAARFARLRKAGVPMTLDARAAWRLSGGVMGSPDGGDDVALATIAAKVPDCEAFLEDFREGW